MSKTIEEINEMKTDQEAAKEERDRRRDMYERVVLTVLHNEILQIIKDESEAFFWKKVSEITEDILRSADEFAEGKKHED